MESLRLAAFYGNTEIVRTWRELGYNSGQTTGCYKLRDYRGLRKLCDEGILDLYLGLDGAFQVKEKLFD